MARFLLLLAFALVASAETTIKSANQAPIGLHADAGTSEVTPTIKSTTFITTTSEPSTQEPIETTSAVVSTSSEASASTSEAPVTTPARAPIPIASTVSPTVPSTAAPTAPEGTTWNVTNKSGHSCLLLNIAVQFRYRKEKENKTVNLPRNATQDPSSTCGSDTDLLVLTWEEYTVTFEFDKTVEDNKTTGGYHLGNLTLVDEKITGYLNTSGRYLAGRNGTAYKCNHEEIVPLTNGEVYWKDVRVQAFMDQTDSKDFTNDQVCTADDTTNDIVPIAVGCALIALVIIVLIAYIVGRRISRQKGYQSV